MTIVHKMNGEGGNSEGVFAHAYSGKPAGSFYEFRVGEDSDTVQGLGVEDPNDYVGSTFKVPVEVRLVGVTKKDMKDGVVDVLSLRVVNSGPLKLIARGHKEDKTPKSDEPETDPNQMTLDAAAGDWTGSTEGAPDDPDNSDPDGGGGKGNVTAMFSDGS